jgi:hypothetical protein
MPGETPYTQTAANLSRVSLFRCNSVDYNRERRRRKRQWQKRRNSTSSSDLHGADSALEDNMIYTDEPIEMDRLVSSA